MTSPRFPRSWVFWGLYLPGAALFVVLAVEIGCRTGMIPNLAYRMARELTAPADMQKLLVLGDSFSEDAAGSSSRLLKDHLRARGVFVANLAEGGLGPLDYRDRLLWPRSFRPETILVNYYVGNDLTDTRYRLDRAASPARDTAKALLSRTFTGRLLLELRARRFREARWKAAEKDLLPEFKRTSPQSPPINLFLLEAARMNPDHLVDNLLMESPGARAAWEENLKVLLEIEAIAELIPARLIINIIPSTLQVDRSHAEFYRQIGFRLDERLYSTREPQDRLITLCRHEGIECHDLLPAFRARAGETLYAPDDDHWNALGEVRAFESILERLRELNVVKP